MKILHTSDWHIGQVFYNYDRSDEHRHFFEWLAGIVREHTPDVMVVCGDIFHTAAPSISAQKLYIESLVKIHEAAPEMTVVVTAGNHDSGSRIEVDRLLWENFNVRTIGNVERMEENLSRHIVPIGDPVVGYVVAIPHCYPLNFPVFGNDMPREDRQVAFFRKILEKIKDTNTGGLPVVLTAHSTVIGSNPGKQELTVGGIDSIDIGKIGDGFDYMALGHIHFPQDIGNNARYCGSAIPVSFNENYDHSVTLVEIESAGGPVRKTVIKAPQKREMVTMPSAAVEFDEALAMLEAFPNERDSYIRLNVKTKQYGGADWAERAIAATENKKCRYCCLLMENEHGQDHNQRRGFSQEEFRKVSPMDIAMLYWQENRQGEMDQELAELMELAIAEATKTNQDDKITQ